MKKTLITVIAGLSLNVFAQTPFPPPATVSSNLYFKQPITLEVTNSCQVLVVGRTSYVDKMVLSNKGPTEIKYSLQSQGGNLSTAEGIPAYSYVPIYVKHPIYGLGITNDAGYMGVLTVTLFPKQ